MSKSIALLVIALAVSLNLVAGDKCLSCDWLSPEGTKALFHMNAHIGDGEVMQMGGSEALTGIMRDMEAIKNIQTCNENLAGRLITMMARLEEGEDPTQKNQVPYVRQPLTKLLEEYFVNYLKMCLSQGSELVKSSGNSAEVQSAWKTFLEFGVMSMFGGADPKEGSADYRKAVMKRAKQIMSFEYLYEKISTIWGKFFGAKVEAGPDECLMELDSNLNTKYKSLIADLSKTFEPLLMLANYNPENFVKIPRDAKSGRPIFAALLEADAEMSEDKEFAELLALYQLMKKTLRRARDYCPLH